MCQDDLRIVDNIKSSDLDYKALKTLGTPFLIILFSFFSACEEPVKNAAQNDLNIAWKNLQLRNGMVYLPNSDSPFNGVSKSKYKNGQTYLLAKFENGILENFKIWTENGIPQIEGAFVQGELSELSKLFDPELRSFELPVLNTGSNVIDLRQHFGLSEDCQRKGSWTFWHPNGQKMKAFSYAGGKLDGSFSKWHEDGMLLIQLHYSQGKMNGEWLEHYHPYGHLKEKRNYQNGMPLGIWAKWAPSGIMLEKCFYLDGLKNGIYMIWHENGQIAKKAIYKNGELNGFLDEFSPSGQQLLSTGYKNGQKWGLEKKWYSSGSLSAKIFWNDKGRKHNKAETWFTNGNLKTVRLYENGKLIEAQSWKPNGKLNSEAVQNGNGKLVFFDQEGLPTHTQLFQDGEQTGN